MNSIKKLTLSLYANHKDIFWYGVFGVLTTVVNIAIFQVSGFLFVGFSQDIKIQLSNIIAWLVAILFAYYTNRKFVFRSNERGKQQFRELWQFVSARVLSLLVEAVLLHLAIVLAGLSEFLCKTGTSVIVILMNYFLSKFWIFKKTKS